MSIERSLKKRSNESCELCGHKEKLNVYNVLPKTNDTNEKNSILICEICKNQLEGNTNLDTNHWRCLNDSIWNENLAVQVTAWRQLYKLKYAGQDWASDLIDMMYFEEDTIKWAEATGDHINPATKIIHKDCNGNILSNGDSVVLIQDLKVKGGGFTAKRGEAVHRISLVHDNAEHIEGKVDNQHIVILTKYVKKTK